MIFGTDGRTKVGPPPEIVLTSRRISGEPWIGPQVAAAAPPSIGKTRQHFRSAEPRTGDRNMIRRVTTAMTVLSVLVLGAPALAEDSKEPIKLTLHDWTGQLITTRLMGEALKNAGLNVEYVPADYLAQFAGLKTGDLHVAMEIWETTGRDAMDEATGPARWRTSARPACTPSRSGGTPNT